MTTMPPAIRNLQGIKHWRSFGSWIAESLFTAD